VKGLHAYGSAPSGPARDLPGPLDSQLGLGARRDNVTIVLSDIVNFSSLVTASRPDDLKEAMGRYYQQARQAVFDHGGMLDKFIGDAVFAVFGYPLPSQEAPCQAIRFALSLTAIGRSVMNDWQAELNAVIETGTRIGIATGIFGP
jgi:adenylate cyclase